MYSILIEFSVNMRLPTQKKRGRDRLTSSTFLTEAKSKVPDWGTK
jgi:hypothetical protein